VCDADEGGGRECARYTGSTNDDGEAEAHERRRFCGGTEQSCLVAYYDSCGWIFAFLKTVSLQPTRHLCSFSAWWVHSFSSFYCLFGALVGGQLINRDSILARYIIHRVLCAAVD
jgi:hypothetical protein